MISDDTIYIQTCQDENCPYNNFETLESMLNKINRMNIKLQKVKCLNLCRYEKEGAGVPPFIKYHNTIYSDITESRLREIISVIIRKEAS